MSQRVAYILLFFLGVPVWGQDLPNNSHQQSTPPVDARYEIVQSQLAAKWTFRLDRFTGRVSQLVKNSDDDSTWERMEIIGLPAITPARARFQIFTSGLAARYTFLIDTTTGITWMVVTGKRRGSDGSESEVNVWQPFAQ
jgi:hypothetical protein